MSYPDQSGRPDPADRDDDPRSPRHRARHSAAAPDPYADESRPANRRRGGRPVPTSDEAYPGGGGYYEAPGVGSYTEQFARIPGDELPLPDLDERTGRRRGQRADRRRADRHSADRHSADRHSAANQRRAVDQQGTAGQQPKKSRAGRNLPAAIGVGLGMAALVLGPLIFLKPAFVLVLAVAAGVGIWEMVRAVGTVGIRPPLIPLLVGGVGMLAVAWYGGDAESLVLGFLVSAVSAIIWRIADGPAGFHRDLGASVLILLYVPFLLGFGALLARPDDGGKRVLLVLALVVLSDTGGYAAGVFFGKNPMAPTISPKKSWEGLAGSLLGTAIGSAILMATLFEVAWWKGALAGLAVSAAAVVGDLAESLIKRDLGVKDMSNLLPGHGGMMDRLDSVLFAVPTVYLLLQLLAPA